MDLPVPPIPFDPAGDIREKLPDDTPLAVTLPAGAWHDILMTIFRLADEEEGRAGYCTSREQSLGRSMLE